MKSKLALSLICMLSLPLMFASSSKADAPNPDEVTIKDIVYNGSGCPPGSADVRLARDGSSFRLVFGPEFEAEVGPGVPLIESRKNCQVLLTLNVPQGFTFAVGIVDYRGSADIASGSRGLFRATHYFQGEADESTTTQTFDGPFSGDWRAFHVVELTELVWAPCGVERALNINASIRLARGSARWSDSFMTVDSERGRLFTLIQFHWKTCP